MDYMSYLRNPDPEVVGTRHRIRLDHRNRRLHHKMKVLALVGEGHHSHQPAVEVDILDSSLEHLLGYMPVVEEAAGIHHIVHRIAAVDKDREVVQVDSLDNPRLEVDSPRLAVHRRKC
jgi:hypothetical protein